MKTHNMRGTVLNTTVMEKDLGLTISADVKVSDQELQQRRETKFLD